MTTDNIVQRIVAGWDCCGTCGGGVLAMHVRQVRAEERERCAREIEEIGALLRERKAHRPDKWEVSYEYLANRLRGRWPRPEPSLASGPLPSSE